VTDKKIRIWVAELKYPNKKKFLTGNFFLRFGATDQEIRGKIIEKTNQILPKGFEIVSYYGGQIILVPEENAEASLD
jgi:hypothetical protein